jgi:hypothetical protein
VNGVNEVQPAILVAIFVLVSVLGFVAAVSRDGERPH